jgi:hypothetical protein
MVRTEACAAPGARERTRSRKTGIPLRVQSGIAPDLRRSGRTVAGQDAGLTATLHALNPATPRVSVYSYIPALGQECSEWDSSRRRAKRMVLPRRLPDARTWHACEIPASLAARGTAPQIQPTAGGSAPVVDEHTGRPGRPRCGRCWTRRSKTCSRARKTRLFGWLSRVSVVRCQAPRPHDDPESPRQTSARDATHVLSASRPRRAPLVSGRLRRRHTVGRD